MFRRALLIFGCLGVFAVALELVSLLFYVTGISGFYHRPWYADPNSWQKWRTEVEDWGAWHIPSARARQVVTCFDIEYRSNSIGARDIERSLDSKVRRIIMLGDSFVEGYGVNVNDRMSNMIEKFVGAPVLNFGSAGHFSIVQYYLIYRDLASQFSHDAVVIGFLPDNDFTDNDPEYPKWISQGYRYRPYYRRSGDQFEIFYKTDKPERMITFDDYADYTSPWMIYYRCFWSSGIIAQLRHIKRNWNSSSQYSGYFETSPERLQAAFYFLRQIKRIAGERPVYVFLIPRLRDLQRLRREDSPVAAAFHSFGDKVGIKVIDLAPAMASEPDLDSLYLPCDGHWSRKGHQRAAELLSRELVLDP